MSARYLLPLGIALLGLACGGGTSTGNGGSDATGHQDLAPGDAPADLAADAPTEAAPGETADDVAADPGTTPDVAPDGVAPGADIVGGCQECAYGTLKGLTCAPDGKTVVSGVTVSIDTVDCAGNPLHLETVSDAQGRYLLPQVPCGQQKVHLTKGSYAHAFDIWIDAGMEVEAINGRCFGATAAKIAVLTGKWDAIEYLLNNLKLKFDLYDSDDSDGGMSSGGMAMQLLQDAKELAAYNVIFVNCGQVHSMIAGDPTVRKNLDDWVEKGGSFYGSDYADVYVNMIWPWAWDQPDAYSIFSQTVHAEVIDPPLFAYLGKMQQDIQYQLGPISTVKAPGKNPTTGEDTMVHLRGEFKEYPGEVRPIMLSFRPYPKGGKVMFANFHHEEQTGPLLAEVARILYWVVFEL